MKNASLILNIVLLLAVIVLFYFQFSTPQSGGTSRSSDTTKLDLKVAFIHSDSIVKHYEYVKVHRTELESKTKKMDQDYRNRVTGLQNEINAYQRNLPNMTLGQARAVEEDLAKKQQNLQLYQQSLSQQLMEEEAKLTEELYKRVTSYLDKYAKDNGLQLVLKFDPTSDVLFAGQAIDITSDVIEGLNAEYALETKKGTTPAKADTTSVKKK